MSYDRDTKRIKTRDEYVPAFITESVHLELSVVGAVEFLMLWVFTFNPLIKLPSNTDAKEEIILTNNSMKKCFPNSIFKLVSSKEKRKQNGNDQNNTNDDDKHNLNTNNFCVEMNAC